MKKDVIMEDMFMSKVEKGAEAHLVVAALIATVTFTAGITVPGGFVSERGADQGFAILRTNVTFKAFLISNSLAMVLSTLSAFIQLFVPLWFGQYITFSGSTSFLAAFSLTILALGAMMLAFFTGIFAVLGIYPTILCSFGVRYISIPCSIVIPASITIICLCLPLLLLPGLISSLRIYVNLLYVMALVSFRECLVLLEDFYICRVLSKWSTQLKKKKKKLTEDPN